MDTRVMLLGICGLREIQLKDGCAFLMGVTNIAFKKQPPITGLRGPEGSGQLRLQITRHSAHEGGEVVTLTHRPPLPPGIFW